MPSCCDVTMLGGSVPATTALTMVVGRGAWTGKALNFTKVPQVLRVKLATD